jgi:Peptidase family M28
MLDPRIYRMALLPVVLAVIVLAFSLGDQQGGAGTNLAPDAYNGQNAFNTMQSLAASYPDRRAGSTDDNDLAAYVAGKLKGAGFQVSTDVFTGRTLDGPRTLENVVGVRAGLGNGSIVVVAHRDSLSAPGTADLSGTAVLLELARVLSEQTQQRTVVMASTTGSVGAVGATRLARNLPQPVDAVIALGDLAGTAVHGPLVVPWSDSQLVAPTMLRKTLAGALSAQTQLAAGSTGLVGQLAHLVLPMTPSEQGPFGSAGEPAVLLSLSGDASPPPGEPVSVGQITALGRTVTQAVTALSGGSSVPSPSVYLLFSGKTVPAWAIALLVLALLIPVLVATIDGLARARRRGHSISRWLIWVVSGAVPFALAVALVVMLRAVGAINAPPAPVGGAAVAVHGGAIGVLAGIAVVVVAGLIWLRRGLIWLLGPGPRELPGASNAYGPGTAAALLLVMCVATLLIWFSNPFAALLLIPALHLWMWIVVPDVRLPVPAALAMLLAGFAAPAVIAVAYATSLGLDPLQALWSSVLLLAGGGVSTAAALEWSVVLGCTFGVILIAVQAARVPREEDAPVTIRGPVTYAGPGSLGGTESAIRR